MSRATPDLTQGFTGISLPSTGPRQMGTDADGRTSVITFLNQVTQSAASLHDNQTDTRPDYLPINGLWCYTAPNGIKTVYQYDGSADIPLFVTQGGRLVGPYLLGEFYFFRHPTLRPGFQPCQGGLLESAATLYPEAWAYLQTTEGQLLCKTEAEWQALSTDVFRNADGTPIVLADGTSPSWNGIGGAPFFVPDTATGALRLPDIRGMYPEAAGFDSLDVGGVHGDGIPPITGNVMFHTNTGLLIDGTAVPTGAFYAGTLRNNAFTGATQNSRDLAFDSGRVLQAANKVAPRAFGVLPCVYLGRPAS